MEARLRSLNSELSQLLHELESEYVEEVKTLQSIPQDPKTIPPPNPEVSKAVELLNNVQKILTPPLHTVIDGMFGFTVSKALSTAVTCGVSDIIEANGPLTAAQIAEHTVPKTASGPLSQLLRLLASSGIFTHREVDDTFDNNAPSFLLTKSHWTQWYRWAELYPTRFYDIFANLEPAMAHDEQRTATHITYNAEAAEPLFTLVSRLPWAKQFFETIGAGSTAMAPGILADYPWLELIPGPVCDLAGGNGEFLFTILNEFQDMKGALLELDGSMALKSAKENFQAESGKFLTVTERVIAIHAGDMFAKIPSYPFYTIRWTLHNWSDDQAVMILKNVRDSIQQAKHTGSRLLIIEAMVTNEKMARPALYGSAVMLSGSKGGKERTEHEWRSLCDRSGWIIHMIYRPRNCIPNILDLRVAD